MRLLFYWFSCFMRSKDSSSWYWFVRSRILFSSSLALLCCRFDYRFTGDRNCSLYT